VNQTFAKHLPFGFFVEWDRARRITRSAPIKWLLSLRALLIGNGDLHGLVRCPPLAKRWDRQARRVCDVGCGSGTFHIESLLRSAAKGIVVGVEVDYPALLMARQQAERCGLDSRVVHVCASGDRLPFRDGVFDQLFLVDVIEHVPDDQCVLQESRRVLRDGGLIEISTPTPLYPTIFGDKMHTRVGHVRPGYGMPALVGGLEAAGFEPAWVGQNTGYLLWPWMGLWFRVGWFLWESRARGIKRWLLQLVFNLLLVVLALLVRVMNGIDAFGGYCSNDIEARKQPALLEKQR
jgi:SAM-dependent methyltransferase